MGADETPQSTGNAGGSSIYGCFPRFGRAGDHPRWRDSWDTNSKSESLT